MKLTTTKMFNPIKLLKKMLLIPFFGICKLEYMVNFLSKEMTA